MTREPSGSESSAPAGSVCTVRVARYAPRTVQPSHTGRAKHRTTQSVHPFCPRTRVSRRVLFFGPKKSQFTICGANIGVLNWRNATPSSGRRQRLRPPSARGRSVRPSGDQAGARPARVKLRLHRGVRASVLSGHLSGRCVRTAAVSGSPQARTQAVHFGLIVRENPGHSWIDCRACRQTGHSHDTLTGYTTAPLPLRPRGTALYL